MIFFLRQFAYPLQIRNCGGNCVPRYRHSCLSGACTRVLCKHGRYSDTGTPAGTPSSHPFTTRRHEDGIATSRPFQSSATAFARPTRRIVARFLQTSSSLTRERTTRAGRPQTRPLFSRCAGVRQRRPTAPPRRPSLAAPATISAVCHSLFPRSPAVRRDGARSGEALATTTHTAQGRLPLHTAWRRHGELKSASITGAAELITGPRLASRHLLLSPDARALLKEGGTDTRSKSDRVRSFLFYRLTNALLFWSLSHGDTM